MNGVGEDLLELIIEEIINCYKKGDTTIYLNGVGYTD